MSLSIYLAAGLSPMLEHMSQEIIRHRQKTQNLFYAPIIITPNRNYWKWIQLELSEKTGICANMQFFTLEDGLYHLLQKNLTDDKKNHRLYRQSELKILIISALLALIEKKPIPAELSVFYHYLYQQDQKRKDYYIRLWQLAGLLSAAYREYEFHSTASNTLINEWQKKNWISQDKPEMEQAQGYLYRQIFASGQIFAKLNDYMNQNHGYGIESLYIIFRKLSKVDKQLPIREEQEMVYLFPLPDLSQFHRDVLQRLARFYFIRLYKNQLDRPLALDPGLREYCRPYQGSLQLYANVQPVILSTDQKSDTVLHCWQTGKRQKLSQDTSVQIFSAIGVYREVETVYHSIITNLRSHPEWRPNDIHIYVTDMARYRPAIQSVFSRRNKELPYRILELNAKKESTYGRAVLGLIRMIGGNYTRKEVVEFIQNPCFLAGQHVREGIKDCIDKTEVLNIFHSYDEKQRQQKGYLKGEQFTWRQGMERLRLGRLMDIGQTAEDEFANIAGKIPYGSIIQSDNNLQIFAVLELLFFETRTLAGSKLSAAEWKKRLLRLINRYLAVPDSLAEEESVRSIILEKLEDLDLFHYIFSNYAGSKKISTAWIYQFIEDVIEQIPSGFGATFGSAVVISGWETIKAIPAKITYIMGLNEELFPSIEHESSLNLLKDVYLPGKYRNIDRDRQNLWEAILSSQEKVYLSYCRLQPEKQQELFMSPALVDIKQFLTKNLLTSEFQILEIPLEADKIWTMSRQPAYFDLYENYFINDKIIYYLKNLPPDSKTISHLKEQLETIGFGGEFFREEFEIPDDSVKQEVNDYTLPLDDLKKFLEEPSNYRARKKLSLYDASSTESYREAELFAFDLFHRSQMILSVLRYYIAGEQTTTDDYRSYLEKLLQYQSKKSNTPEGAFGQYSYHKLLEEIETRINNGLSQFRQQRANWQFIQVVIGKNLPELRVGSKLCHYQSQPIVIANGRQPVNIAIELSQPFIWTMDRKIHILCFTNSKVKKKLHINILPAFLLMAYARSRYHSELVDLLGDKDCHIYLSHKDGIDEYYYPYDKMDDNHYKHYIHDMIYDLLYDNDYSILPLKIIFSNDFSIANRGLDKQEFQKNLRKEFEKEIRNDRSFHYIPADYVRLTQVDLTENAHELVEKRIEPIFQAEIGGLT